MRDAQVTAGSDRDHEAENVGNSGTDVSAAAAVRRLPVKAAGDAVMVNATSWTPVRGLDMREWTAHGHRLGVIGRAAGWWIGDWLRYGHERWGERYVRASRITGYDVQTLMNMVYVASRVESARRRGNLSWSHHAEVAALTPEQQERWLDFAERERLSVRCFREEIRRERARDESLGAAAARGPQRRTAAGLICPHCGKAVEAEGG